ncbi:class I SAM-dependent methyltransferase [Silvibacterium sp.]|uniref:class I SAM-dependent methyltransferase n=1 Tax=Silvibacterium sp. TaxID=1964179 RepID=UPI0039E40D8A
MPPAIAISERAAILRSRPDGFGRLARLYRWLEYLSFGPWLTLCRNARLRHPSVAAARHALILGDGDGRFLTRLLRWNPDLRALSIDGSHGMLARQRQRAAEKGVIPRLTTRCQEIRSFQPSGRYDLITTHFLLDCLSTAEVEALASRMRPCLAVGPGRNPAQNPVWIVSEFAIPSGIAQLPSRFIVRGLYLAFGLMTGLRARSLPDHGGALHRAGFFLRDRRTWLAGLLVSEVWATQDSSPRSHPSWTSR